MNKKTNKFIIPLLIVSIGINVFVSSKISNMKNDLRNLQSQVSGIEGNLNSSINNISYSVSEALRKEASIINDFQFKYGDFKDGMVDLNLNVKPKEISADRKYYFSYTCGDNQPQIVPATKDEGNNYYASVKVPIKDDIKVDFIIEHKDTKTVETLNHIYNFEERLLKAYNVRREHGSTSFGNNILSLKNSSYELSHYPYEYDEKESREKESKSIKNASLYLTVNDKIIDSFPMKKDKDPFPSHMNIYKFTFEDYSIDLKDKDIFQLYIIAEHEDGYKIRFDFDDMIVDENSSHGPHRGSRDKKYIIE